MLTTNDILKIAREEIGYHEKATNANLDSKTANKGSKNWTKYARDLYNAGFFNGNKNGYEWCTSFVNWVFFKATGSKEATMKALCQAGNLGAGCVFARQYYQKAGRLYDDPQVGDQAFFGFTKGDPDHTGIVESVGVGTFITIEGNQDDQVSRCVHSLTSSWVMDFGRPLYDEDTNAEVKPVEEDDEVNPIKAAQTFFNEYGKCGLEVDGEWGPLTNTGAIKCLQKSVGVSTDGVIGPITRKAIKNIQNGSTGDEVKVLQASLSKAGHNLEIDGEFGKLTKAAVEKYQSANGLEVDGIAGKDTFTKLLA